MKDDTSPAITANGQAFRAYLETALNVLDQLSVIEYYPSRLPSVADEVLMEVVNAFTAWPLPVRERFLGALPSEKRGLFGIFGHRLATLAVRESNPEYLRLGLVGNAVANYQIPPNRKVDVALAVFYHCARKLELEPQTLFEEAARFASDEMAVRMVTFGRRSDVTLKQFGWREIKTPEGILYKFDWT